jgi:hypothetical protein
MCFSCRSRCFIACRSNESAVHVSGYRVLPFPGGRGTGEVIEVYPGATLRQMGLAAYKSQPQEAVHLGS